MNYTKHFLERWVERIVGITDTRERNEYIVKNKERIIEHSTTMFENSRKIYTGQIGSNVTRNYYIKDDIILITNTTDDALITVYKIDLGFTNRINLMVAKELLDEINQLNEEKEKVELETLNEIEDMKLKVYKIEEEIENLSKQINNLNKLKESIESTIKSTENVNENTELELKRLTSLLVNSKEYKEDLQTL